MIPEIRQFLGEDWIRTDALMARYLASDIRLLDRTNASLLEGSGKKIRPLLCLLIAKAIGGQVSEDTCHYAAAMELLHNATLLHDDVVDGSDERRGRPTVQSLMGGTASVLIGDYWLVKALECILDTKGPEMNEILRMFSWTLSSLASGEILQLQMALSGETREEEYLRIIRCKTACMFETAAVAGALSAGASEAVTAAARSFALNLGLAFQIRDDILDYTGGVELGKPVGQDLMEQKITLPLLGAFANASPEKEKTIRRKICAIGEHPEYRDEIVGFVTAHDGIAFAESRLEEYIAAAKNALTLDIPALPGEAKESLDWLLRLADYNALRRV